MKMKKLALALTALAALSGSALAADLPARTYTKAPVVVPPAANWTGFWISGGFGYGMSEYQHSEFSSATGAPFSVGQDLAGKGWLGKVGLGYDYQFMGNFVIGAFADADWSNIGGQGTFTCPVGCPGTALSLTGTTKNDWSWSAGGRIGYVALPGLLTYFNGGYTQAHLNQTNYFDSFPGDAGFGTYTGMVMPSQTRGGYFLGGGTEYAVSQVPGLFWKNEVRFSDFGNKTNTAVCTVAGGSCGPVGPTTILQTSHLYEQKATTEFVYRFNWGGPVVAKY
jgi:outer membrane immunogenic protein